MGSTDTKAEAGIDIEELSAQLAGWTGTDGGTLAGLCGFSPTQMEAAYALGFNLYGQRRWLDALKTFSFLVVHDHLERRYRVAQAACLQMLRRYDEALQAYGFAYLMDATDPAVALSIAECLIALGRRADAVVVLETAEALARDARDMAPVGERARALAVLLHAAEARQ